MDSGMLSMDSGMVSMDSGMVSTDSGHGEHAPGAGDGLVRILPMGRIYWRRDDYQ